MASLVMSNESLANLIFEKLDGVLDIVCFSEVNKCCNTLSKQTLEKMKEKHLTQVFENYVFYLNEYNSVYDTCKMPGMFIFFISDCHENLNMLETYAEENKEYLGELVDNIYVLREDLKNYEWDVMEESSSQLDLATY